MRKVVARGSIRVDARRAVEKLREHLLLDLRSYPQEIVRAAVAGRATAVDVRHDAELLAITFDGDPLPGEVLPRLLDHVLEVAPERESRRRRYLALGVNAALGLGPASVDVICADAEGAARVRWTPALLEVDEQGEPARLPELERVPLPEGMRPGMIRVEVRQRFGWQVIRSALSGALPQEIQLLLDASFALPAKLTLAGRPPPRSARPRALVRAPFDLRGARRALLEIVPLSGVAPVIELLEQGVCLLRVPLRSVLALPLTSEGDCELPLRLIVDADELPTNVSRSALREDAPYCRHVEQAAIPALIEAMRALTSALRGRGELPESVETELPSVEDAELALSGTAGKIARIRRAGGVIPAELAPLLDLPLLESAFGGPLSLRVLDELKGAPLQIWQGGAPLPEALRPFLREVVWQRDRLSRQLLAGVTTADVGPLVDQARSGLERRRLLFERAPSAPRLAPAESERLPATLLRVPFDVKDGELAGLHGELAIFRDLAHARKIHAFVEGRLLQVVDFEPALLPLPIEAAITWEGKVRPRLSFDGVDDDQGFRLAVHHVSRVALFALDLEARRLAAEGADLRPLAPIFRAAITTHADTPRRLGLTRPPEDPPLASFKGLHLAPIWPTTEPERWLSAQAIETLCERGGALFVAGPGAVGRAADGRPVLAVKLRDARAIAEAQGAAIVPYDDALIAPGGLPAFVARGEKNLAAALEQRLGKRGAPVLAVSRPGMRARITPSLEAVVIWCHAGRTLATAPLPPELGPVAIAVDDDTLVPDAAWGALLCRRAPASLEPLERVLCGRIVAAIEGDTRAKRELGFDPQGAPPSAGSLLRDYLLDRVARLRTLGEAALPGDAALAARIEALPLITVLDAQGAPVTDTLAATLRRHPAPLRVPALFAPPGFETLDWRPLLLASAPEQDRLARWSLHRLALAVDELPARLAAAQVDRERRAFLTRPALDPRDLSELSDPGALTVTVDPEPGAPIAVTAALPRAAVTLEQAWIELLFQGRAVCRRQLGELALPVVARVDLTDVGLLQGFRDLSSGGLLAVGRRVHLAAEKLGRALLARAGAPGQGAAFFGDAAAIRLVDRLTRGSSADTRSLARMLEAPAEMWILPARGVLEPLLSGDLRWPTVQGDEQPLASLHGGASMLFVGDRVHVPWRGPGADAPAELDRPILHAPLTPAGDALRGLCDALGRRPRDVSAALAKLQARRAAEAPAEPPRLPGTPLHPALRASLAELGLRGIEGELEIGEAGGSSLTLLDPLDDSPRQVEIVLPFPVKILARGDLVDPSRDALRGLLAKLGRAAVRHLLTLAPRFDELPPALRVHLRAMVCKAVAGQRKVQKRASAAPIFEDVHGAFHSLDALLRDPALEWGCTLDPPPYPARLPAMSVLRLTQGEMQQLAGAVRFKDLTSILRRRREGELRASAPQLAEIALEAHHRALCLHTFRVDDDGLSGEIGVLMPEHAGLRGIAFHFTRRPVCQLGDGPGDPLLAAIDDESAPINAYFNGFRTASASQRIQERVRALADRAHTVWLLARPAPVVEEAEAMAEEIAAALDAEIAAAAPHDPMVTTVNDAPPEGSWMSGLVRAVRAFFGHEELIAGESPLSVALLRAMISLDLPGRPVEAVVEARGGRPLRYHLDARRLVLNPRSPALRWLTPTSHEDPRALALLSAAALSEIKRGLAPLTDEAERRALALLLQRLPE